MIRGTAARHDAPPPALASVAVRNRGACHPLPCFGSRPANAAGNRTRRREHAARDAGGEGTARLSPTGGCGTMARHVQADRARPDRRRRRHPQRVHVPAPDAAGVSAPALHLTREERARLGARDRADDHRGPRGRSAGRPEHRSRRRGRSPTQDDRPRRRRRNHVPLLPQGLGPDRSVRGIRVPVPRLAGRPASSLLRAADGGERDQTDPHCRAGRQPRMTPPHARHRGEGVCVIVRDL
jgi:hypothetical protein